mgnify:CR=1 FL=1
MKWIRSLGLLTVTSLFLFGCVTQEAPRASGIVPPDGWVNSTTGSGITVRFPENWVAVGPRAGHPGAMVAVLVGPSVDLSVYRFEFEQPLDPGASARIYQEEIMSGLDNLQLETVPSPSYPTYQLLGVRSGRWYLVYLIIAGNELWVAESVGTLGDIDAGAPVVRGIVSTISQEPEPLSQRQSPSIRFSCPDGRWRWDSDIDGGFSILGVIEGVPARINILAAVAPKPAPDAKEVSGGLWVGNRRYDAWHREEEPGKQVLLLNQEGRGYILEVLFAGASPPPWAPEVHTREEFRRVLERYLELV